MIHQLKCNSTRQDSINLWKVADALVSLKGILSHSQNHIGPTVKVSSFAASSISTCHYPDLKFNIENQMVSWRQLKMSSILGNVIHL